MQQKENRERLFQQLSRLSPCDLADALAAEQFMDHNMRALWSGMSKIVGTAFTVECYGDDHLMFHAAIYRADPGDIIVAKGGLGRALAGGNVCAIAQKRGITGVIADGLVRDLAEIREMRFPIFARGAMPKPGVKKALGTMREPIICGGVKVENGDFIVADEEGIAVVPKASIDHAIDIASKRAEKDASVSLEQWQAQHQETVENALKALDYKD